jgi:hypothetical protein
MLSSINNHSFPSPVSNSDGQSRIDQTTGQGLHHAQTPKAAVNLLVAKRLKLRSVLSGAPDREEHEFNEILNHLETAASAEDAERLRQADHPADNEFAQLEEKLLQLSPDDQQ